MTRKCFLAIRHKPSGGFLPAVRGFGFTQMKPSLEDPPRLFTKMGPCNQALNNWLEGEQYAGEANDDGVMSVRITPRPERKRADMEIVEIEITARTLSEADLRRL